MTEMTPKTPINPSTDGVNVMVTPALTTETSTSSPQPCPYLPHLLLVQEVPCTWLNPKRGPSQTRHQAAVSQGASCKANRPVTSHAVVQLLDVLDEVTEELQCEESMEKVSSIEEVHEIAKEFQESP